MKRYLTLIVALLVLTTAQAFEHKVVAVHSPSMEKDVAVTLILPDGYDTATEPYDVVYLLHGFGNDNESWHTLGGVARFADQYGLIFVCPDGAKSWYWDSPIDPTLRYETFVAEELVAWVDGNLKSRPERTSRAITGLSMGGHGALYLGTRHPQTFGAMGSTSGGVDIRPFPTGWEMHLRLGMQEEHPENWEQHTVINLVEQIPTDGSQAIIIDCGTEDFFYEVNCNLHQKMLSFGIPHDFYVRPGKHHWPYWQGSIAYQLLFFDNYFKNN